MLLTHIYACTHAHTHMCMHTHTHVCTRTYTHTHTHTNEQTMVCLVANVHRGIKILVGKSEYSTDNLEIKSKPASTIHSIINYFSRVYKG